jgi:hypothetical protein
MYDLSAALISLRPGATWSLNGDEYSGLVWSDSIQSKPTYEECVTEMARLKADYDAKEYQRLRKYPTIQDQLDMLYWDKVNNTNVWKDTIQAVKDQFPKSN